LDDICGHILLHTSGSYSKIIDNTPNTVSAESSKQKEQTTGNQIMKAKCLRLCGVSMAAGGLVFLAGCVVEPNGVVRFRPVIVAPAPVYVAPPPVYVPPPVVEEPVMVPETYVVVDGEYMGVVGDQYFYLGPGGAWLVCDPVRLERFHGWERDHRDWREHAIRNDRFRRDAHGRVQPMRAPGKAAPKKEDERR
jgi:hypothetical protein